MLSGSIAIANTSSSHIIGSTSRLGSPSTFDNVPEDNSNVFTNYLHRVAGYSDIEVNTVLKDHCYARPWNWKPENIYVKPTRNIFFSTRQERSNPLREQNSKDETINVEHEDSPEQFSLPCNLTKSRYSMDESQRLANFFRSSTNNDDNNDHDEVDWEETVEKTFWSPMQRRLFTRALNIFRTERLSRLTKSNCSKNNNTNNNNNAIGDASELFYRRSSIDTATKRFREILASTGWDWRIIQWLHTLLLDNLSREYLVIYLDILQTLRAKIPQLIDRMITATATSGTTTQTNNSVIQGGLSISATPVTMESLNALLKRPWDPVSIYLNANRPKKLPGNPILIVILSGISANLSSRQHKWITQLGALGMVVTVHSSHLGLSTNRQMTMMVCMDQLVQVTRTKIQDVRNDCPGRPMVLIGLNTGAALACQIAQMEHVTAVICLGFPFSTVEGKRGCPDDMLMDIRCPVMFVIGQNSSLVRSDDLEDLRGKMLVETSLVVVGTADDHLRISTEKILSEGITQAMVDRCILDEIGDFVSGILLQPHPLPLRPAATISMMNFDKTAIKREPRKRKNSTSSSIDSETNLPSVNKKTRCASSTNRCWYSASSPTTSNSLSVTTAKPSTITVGLPPPSPLAATQSETTTTTAAAGKIAGWALNSNSIGSSHSIPPQPQRRRQSTTRVVSHNPKTMNDQVQLLTKQTAQRNTNSQKVNGGLTLNIGSLASLAPMGPIRLTPNLSGSAAANSNLKSPITSKPSSSSATAASSLSMPLPSVTLTKTSTKLIQTNSDLPGKLTNTVMTPMSTNKSKIIEANYNKNVNIHQEQVGESGKLVTVYTSSGNQVRVASTNCAKQTKSIGTTTPLTAILHSRSKGHINNNRRKSLGSTTILLTSDSDLSSSGNCTKTTTGTSKLITTAPAPTITTSKVIEESSSPSTIAVNSSGKKHHDHEWKNVTRKITKITPKNSTTVQSTPIFQVNENIDDSSNNPSDISTAATDLDDHLENILDIPIIFAKDDDNFDVIEKTSTSTPSSLSISTSDTNNYNKQSVGIKIETPTTTSSSSLSSSTFTSPSTTVVLLSNKDDDKINKSRQHQQQSVTTKITNAKVNERKSTQFITNSDSIPTNNHVILQTSMQNLPMANTISNRVSSDSLSQTNVNHPIKYTKIILSKRHFNKNNNSNNQVILIKNSCKPSSSQAHTNTNDYRE